MSPGSPESVFVVYDGARAANEESESNEEVKGSVQHEDQDEEE